VAEVAVALLLAIAAGLLVRSMKAVQAVPLGFDHTRTMSVGFSPDSAKTRQQGGKAVLERELVRVVKSTPGVVEAGIGPLPLAYGAADTAFTFSAAPADHVQIDVSAVGPGYFEALGTELLAGRFVTEQDGL
jgi:hypothetical protein